MLIPHNPENSKVYSYTPDIAAEIDAHDPESDTDFFFRIIGAALHEFLDFCVRDTTDFETVGKRTIAGAQVLNPELLHGVSNAAVARERGGVRAALSYHEIELKERFGVRGRGQKLETACAVYSEVRQKVVTAQRNKINAARPKLRPREVEMKDLPSGKSESGELF
jgi:hypothetical protein